VLHVILKGDVESRSASLPHALELELDPLLARDHPPPT
jgi:hypothetical protein